MMEKVQRQEPRSKRSRERYCKATDFLYLGRGSTIPVALEGASSSRRSPTSTPRDIRRGDEARPIALIDEKMPVVTPGARRTRLRQDREQHRAGEGAAGASSRAHHRRGTRILDGKADDVLPIRSRGESSRRSCSPVLSSSSRTTSRCCADATSINPAISPRA
jgi:hypothetical protein